MSIKLNAKKRSISLPEYWAIPPRRRPTTFEGLLKRLHPSKMSGIWCVQQTNNESGEVEYLMVGSNAITDNGAIGALKNIFNASAGGIAVANIIAIDASLGIATVGAISSGGTVTSITVTALTGPTIPSGTTLLINPGAGAGTNKLLVSTTQAITGAQTCTVVSTPGPGSSIAAGSFARYALAQDVVGTALSSMPTTDASSLSGASYTAALPSGQFTFNSTTGSGNRNVVISTVSAYIFTTLSNSNPSPASAGTYTAMWLVKASPVASTADTYAHLPLDAPLVISSTLSITPVMTIKI